MNLLPEFPRDSSYRDRWADDSVYFYLEDSTHDIVASCRLIMPEYQGGPFFDYGVLNDESALAFKRRSRREMCEIGGFALPRSRDAVAAAAHLIRAALQFSIERQRYSWVAMINPPTQKLFVTRFGAEFSILGELQEMRPHGVDVVHIAQPVEFDLLRYLATGRAVSNSMHHFMTNNLVVDLRENVPAI